MQKHDILKLIHTASAGNDYIPRQQLIKLIKLNNICKSNDKIQRYLQDLKKEKEIYTRTLGQGTNHKLIRITCTGHRKLKDSEIIKNWNRVELIILLVRNGFSFNQIKYSSTLTRKSYRDFIEFFEILKVAFPNEIDIDNVNSEIKELRDTIEKKKKALKGVQTGKNKVNWNMNFFTLTRSKNTDFVITKNKNGNLNINAFLISYKTENFTGANIKKTYKEIYDFFSYIFKLPPDIKLYIIVDNDFKKRGIDNQIKRNIDCELIKIKTLKVKSI